MKKITFLFVIAVFSCFTAMAQFTFPTQGPVTVTADAGPSTLNLNDAANSAGVTAGSYDSFTITVDWTAVSGDPWSNEAGVSVTSASGTVFIFPPTAGGADDGAGTTLTFDGTFATVYNPTADGTLVADFTQDYAGSEAIWDNIIIILNVAPNCPAPSTLSATNILETSADLNWVETGTATNWDVEIVTSGATPTGVPTSASVGMPYIATGLTGNTSYDFYVRADCGGATSTWVGPFTFITACPSVLTAPLLEDFEGFTTAPTPFTMGNCFTATNSPSYFWESAPGNDVGSADTGPDPSITTGNYFYIEASGSNVGDMADLVSPSVDLSPLTTPALTFNYHMYGAVIGTLDVLVNGTDNVFSLTGQQQASATEGWGLATIDLSSYSGQTITVTFQATGAGTFEGDIAIDNVLLTELPACPAPSGLTATNLTSTSVDVGWVENGSATLWNLELVDITAGATFVGLSTNPGVIMNPFSFTALAPDNDYEVYVQADCGGDLSSWTGPLSFSTPPAPPANDDFINAEILVCGLSYSGDTTFATIDEDDAPDLASPEVDLDAPNVWYTYTGTGDAEDITLDLCASGYDTSILVYTGTSGNLTLVAANDDGTVCGDTRSYLTFQSDGTTTYYITVEGWDPGSVGAYTMDVTCALLTPPPTNDLCTNATTLIINTPETGTTVGATSTIGDDNPSCESTFATIVDVWYDFTATATDMTITSTIGSADQANIAIYTDCALGTELFCSDANAGEIINMTGLTIGTIYIVRVWNDGASPTTRTEGDFTISLVETLSNPTFEAETAFSYYPNPASNVFTLQAQNNNIETVRIINMLGQEVLRATPNSLTSNLDVSNLQSGAYFVQVTIANVTETIRIIKQ